MADDHTNGDIEEGRPLAQPRIRERWQRQIPPSRGARPPISASTPPASPGSGSRRGVRCAGEFSGDCAVDWRGFRSLVPVMPSRRSESRATNSSWIGGRVRRGAPPWGAGSAAVEVGDDAPRPGCRVCPPRALPFSRGFLCARFVLDGLVFREYHVYMYQFSSFWGKIMCA